METASVDISPYRIEVLTSPLSAEQRAELTRFFCTLNREQELFQLRLEQILEANRFSLLWAEDGHIVGIAGLRPKGRFWIFFLVVAQAHQSKGLGKKLTQHLMQTCLPHEIVLLTVLRSNLKARMLYKSTDFNTINRFKSSATMLYGNKAGRRYRWPITCLILLRNWWR